MTSDGELNRLLMLTASQVSMYDKRVKSRIEQQYGESMERSAAMLAKVIRSATFDQLIRIEKTFQKNDLTVYAQLPPTKEAVEQGIRDIKVGEEVYRQLLENTEAYKAHKYRESESIGPGKLIPLDAMRRALRGQMSRVENYRKNVMGNPREHAFISARIAMLRRAESLYDAMQRERLLPAEQAET